MPRRLRVEYSGAIYHVMSRGDRREDIFLDDVDWQDFIRTLAEACRKTGWQVHAYCLMSNHYHLVLETPDANLVAGMAWLQSSYTIRLNHGTSSLAMYSAADIRHNWWREAATDICARFATTCI
ncbi:MAG: transposase [Verrucomicrobia bacterium]|nr:transposase [Verrucomicrobiota bacterium]